MKIQGIVWAGTKTKNYEGTVAFFRDVLGIQVREAVPDGHRQHSHERLESLF